MRAMSGTALVASLVLSGAAPVSAQGADVPSNAINAPQLLAREGCTACHSDNAQGVGPAFDWVSYRYRDTARDRAVQAVAQFIVNGGTGYWKAWSGGLPMPSHAQMSTVEAEDLARWILSLPPVAPPKAGK